MRISCRISTERNSEQETSLKTIWQKLNDVGQEQMIRLRVSAVFHRSVDDYLVKLAELRKMAQSIVADSDTCDRQRQKLRKFLGSRERLFIEIGRIFRLGRLLLTRLKEPIVTVIEHTYSNTR